VVPGTYQHTIPGGSLASRLVYSSSLELKRQQIWRLSGWFEVRVRAYCMISFVLPFVLARTSTDEVVYSSSTSSLLVGLVVFPNLKNHIATLLLDYY